MTNPESRKKATLALLATTSLLATFTFAEPGESQDSKRRGPPPEAFEACSNQSQGAMCAFQGRRGDLEGTCIIPRHDEEALVCAPAGGPPAHRSEKAPT